MPRGIRSTVLAAVAVAATLTGLTPGPMTAVAPLDGEPAPATQVPKSAAPRAATTVNPFTDASRRVRNGVFYYAGNTPLTPAHAADLKRTWGSPAVVVTTAKSDERAAVDAIHATGALAYRYVQFYWAPDNEAYEGINLAEHPEWAYCRTGSTPSLGRTTAGSVKWHYIDANERPVRARLRQILSELRATGWDGVMFDRGQAATQYAADSQGRPIWFRQSTCTQDPYKQGARFSDAYVSMLGLAHAVGLQAVMNNGRSPFDKPVRMRPDPRDRDCQQKRWGACSVLKDIWRAVDLVLNEVPTAPKDKDWVRHFNAHRLGERDATHSHRTLNLVTTSSLGGKSHQNRREVVYAWSRIKLFNLPVAVNTGDGGCGPDGSTSGVCNRYGVYPDLVDTRFGAPRGSAPKRMRCASKRDTVHCVWTRTYGQGMNVVNVKASTQRGVLLDTGLGTCRYVFDVFTRKKVAGGRCVRAFRLDVGPWTGHPLRYSTKPF